MIKNLFFIAVLAASCNNTPTTENSNTESKAVTTTTPATSLQPAIDTLKLINWWQRTDAPYQLKLSGFSANGAMEAVYLNPRPINVGLANWKNENGNVKLYIELRDQNYPGSHYTLYYMADQDMLVGKYFQAVEGTTYDVGFTRVKNQ